MFEKNWASRLLSNQTVVGANLSHFQDRCCYTDNRDYLIFTL